VPAPELPPAWQTLSALAALLPRAGGVIAYVGPGAGLDLIGYALTLLVYALTAFSAVLLWPVYVLLRRIRGGKNKSAPASPTEGVPEGGRASSRADR
jgi:hypothetical protein